jgi:ABC-2 type transport system permease protein
MSSHPSLDRQTGVASVIGHAPGVPVIRNVNWGGLKTLYVKEVRRFFKVHLQTIWAPAITTLLFLIVFTVATGAKKPVYVGGLTVPFADFIAPGLIISQGMMGPAFANASFSLLVGKIQGTIVDYLQPPLSSAELLAALLGGSMTRAFMVGFICWCAMALWPDVHVTPLHPLAVLWFGFLGAMFLSLLGVLTSIWAEKFDHAAAITNFVIAPLSLLSGTFYSVDRLAPAFRAFSHANPFFYIISGFRYGFLGTADSPVLLGSALILALDVALGTVCYVALRRGWKLKN